MRSPSQCVMWSIYLVRDSESNRTYIGATNNLKRRINTHTKKLSATARTTKAFKGCAVFVCAITDIPSKNLALSMEWHAKRIRRVPRIRAFVSVLDHPKFLSIAPTVHVIYDLRDTPHDNPH